MDERFDGAPQGNPLAVRAASLSALFCTLAWAFSYPDREQAREWTSAAFCEECVGLARDAAVGTDALARFALRFDEAARLDGESRARQLRVEHTRLFVTPPRLVPLEGSHWVQHRTLLSRKKGEAFAVKQVYRELGLVNRAEVKDAADHLVSELDFCAYVASAEAGAWEGDDAASAREWKLLRDEFAKDHFGELAFSVAGEVLRLSDNPFLRFDAGLLQAVAASCR